LVKIKPRQFYAMKGIRCKKYNEDYDEDMNKKETRIHADSLINEKKIGILACESRFLVHTIASFQTPVSSIIFLLAYFQYIVKRHHLFNIKF
jgi:hypothetical protein